MMLLVGSLVFLGFLALAVTGWLQWRTLTRVSGVELPGFPTLLGPGTAPATKAHLMDALGRLEHRIAEMEGSSAAPVALNVSSLHGTQSARSKARPADDGLAASIRAGEELLADDEAEKAVDHFEALLEDHPNHPELLLHKGTALERLRRDEDAIECYDQAIRADKNMTMAYLHKGGLYNRLERFNEAMECYEQALRIQEGRPAA